MAIFSGKGREALNLPYANGLYIGLYSKGWKLHDHKNSDKTLQNFLDKKFKDGALLSPFLATCILHHKSTDW